MSSVSLFVWGLRKQGISRPFAVDMNHLSERIGDALCYTAFAPVVRWLRRRHQTILAREQYDYRRIDSILNQIMMVHSDLLS